jgi:hypothetical protein
VTCAVVEGKAVSGEAIDGTVVRLGRRALALRLARSLAPLTNVRLRIAYGEGEESGDLYGKVVAEAGAGVGASGVTVIRLTSVDPSDVRAIEARVAAGTKVLA